MNVFFSVIVPVFNVRKFLPRCIESILQQGCKSFELIMVDDGSTDGSGEICDEYVERFEQCKVIHQENKGLAGARNTGLKHATGKYIVFVDSDDYIEKELLTKACYYLEEKDYDVFSFAARRIDEQEAFLYEMRFEEGVGKYLLAKEREKFLADSFLQYALGWEVCFYIYRRDIIEQNSMRFDESIKYAEDIPFTFEYMLYAKSLIKVPDILYDYTMRNNSITKLSDYEYILQSIFEVIFFIMESKLKNERVYIYYAALLYYFVPSVLKEIDMEIIKKKMSSFDKQNIHQKYWEHIVEHEEEMNSIFGENGRKICDIAMYLLESKE